MITILARFFGDEGACGAQGGHVLGFQRRLFSAASSGGEPEESVVFMDMFLQEEEVLPEEEALGQVFLCQGEEDAGIRLGEDGFAPLVFQVEGDQ